MTDEEAGRVRDFVGYGRHPPDPKWPGGAHVAVNFVINYEEGGERSVPDGDPAARNRPDRRLDRQLCRPRPRRREHVRVRQPRRLLAPAPPVHQAQAAVHGVRHRPRARAQSRGVRRHARGGLGRGRARLQVGNARHHGAGLREEADRAGDREHHPDHRHAAGRLVQPLCAVDADAQPSARRRLRVRQRHLRRRAALLAEGRCANPADRALLHHPQRRALRAPGHDHRATSTSPTSRTPCSACWRRIRRAC